MVAGSGDNGGDGFVAAAELAARGRDVRSSCCAIATACRAMRLPRRGDGSTVLPFNPQAIGSPP